MMKRKTKFTILVIVILLLLTNVVYAESNFSLLDKTITVGNNEDPGNYVFSLKLLLLLTILSLAPSILIMMTSFTRILIVLSLIRNALGLQQTPPNQVIIGIALFLTFF